MGVDALTARASLVLLLGLFYLPSQLSAFDERIEELGGSLDGVNSGNLALSVPSTNGIDAINRFFDDFKRRTGIEWYYANVYKNFEDPTDKTLLNGWVKN